ncbi:AMIN domain-containing protein, partial [Desulfobulbus sp. TB]|nr:AMIN domain-containing protein [Desulfobulbus sp. TB]
MPHFFSTDMQQGKTYSFCCLFYCTVFFSLLLVSFPALAAAEDDSSNAKTLINKISASPSGQKDLEILIHCTGKTDFIPIELSKPSKIIIDIADVAISSETQLGLSSSKSYGVEVTSKVIEDVVRIEFTLQKKYLYKIDWQENNLVLTLHDFFTEPQEQPEEKNKHSSSGADNFSLPNASKQEKKVVQQETLDQHFPTASEVLNSVANSGAGKQGNEQAKAGPVSGRETTSQLGDNAKISVDFYKIDLHNVFRMLREITGKNIVIAEGVSGTLTLALTDVPWQFALDIILNLKDLAKLERDNTIVIYPKDQEFVWPEPEEESLSVEFNEDILAKEKLVITQEKNIPPEQLEAKKLIAHGRAAEKKGNLEIAARFYEQALENWPKNSKLASKISTMYLAQLRQNAKAVFYAQKALKADKKNSAAALNAAIGYANMEENRKALQYFDQSVNIGKPSREALISYAAFSERHRQYDAALRLLGKLEE